MKQKNKPDIITFETFRSIGDYELGNLKQDEASVFNGMLRIDKYKVTVEKIEEPKEVLQERLQKLWDNCDNWHNWTPLKNAANKLGYEFIGESGSVIKNKLKSWK